MAFQYKLEFSFDDTTASDSSVYIQLRNNPPIYQAHIDKENYDVLPEEQKNEFLTNLFLIAGVTELSTRAYRVWLMKSPTYTWEEVLLPVIYYMAGYYGESTIESLPGSGQINGTGFYISNANQRRKL